MHPSPPAPTTIVLPSGRLLELDASGRLAPVESPELHVCAECDSELVQPVDWSQVTGGRWRVERRCPDCERRDVGVYSQELVDRFDERLDEGTDEIVADLKNLGRAVMADDVETFARALDADAILPEDFAL